MTSVCMRTSGSTQAKRSRRSPCKSYRESLHDDLHVETGQTLYAGPFCWKRSKQQSPPQRTTSKHSPSSTSACPEPTSAHKAQRPVMGTDRSAHRCQNQDCRGVPNQNKDLNIKHQGFEQKVALVKESMTPDMSTCSRMTSDSNMATQCTPAVHDVTTMSQNHWHHRRPADTDDKLQDVCSSVKMEQTYSHRERVVPKTVKSLRAEPCKIEDVGQVLEA